MKSEPPAPLHQAQQPKMLQALPALLSATLAMLLYAITLGGGYIFDDRTIVLNDERMHDPRKWSQLWTQAYFPDGIDHLYRPLVSSSYAVEWWLHGDKPWIFHLMNVLLHAMAAAAVAEFTRRALGAFSSLQRSTFDVRRSTFELERTSNVEVKKDRICMVALIAGLLFAAHPIHVEAVANIVGRAELACTAFVFGALILLCHRPLTHRRVFSVVAIGIAGVLCKEQGILQPLLWLFLLIFLRLAAVPKGRFSIVQERPFGTAAQRRNLPTQTLLLATIWIWALYLLIREHFLRFEWERTSMDPTFQPLILSTGIDRIIMPIVLLGHYTALLIWPAHLSLDYGAEVIGHVARAADPYLWIGFAALAIWLIAVVRCILCRTPANQFLLFCLLSLAFTYGIVGNIVTLIGTNFAERLMYLPSAFFLMLVAVAICKLPAIPRNALTAVILVLASFRTVTAARNWIHPLALYQASLAAQPKSIQAHLLLAQEYQEQKNYPDAAKVLQDACDQYPNYWRVWQFRCEEAMIQGDFTTADKALKRAIQLDHNPVTADLGGRLGKAEAATRPSLDQRQ